VIRSLRRVHRVVAPAILAISAAAAVGAGLARKERVPSDWPIAPPGEAPTASFDQLGINLRIASSPAGDVTIWTRSTRWLATPDPLLLWSPTPPVASSVPPPDAVVLGSVAPSFREPTRLTARPADGFLVLWSNGHRRVVGVTPYRPATR